MGGKSIMEEEYQRILKGIKRLPENENMYDGQNGFAALLKKGYLTDSERSLKELEDVVGGLKKKRDFWQGWQDTAKMPWIGETWNLNWLRKENPWLMEKNDITVMDYFSPLSKLMPSNSLLELEEKTFQMADRLSMDLEIPFTSAQLSIIDSISDMAGDKWKNLIAPNSFLSDYERLVENQHKAIQKAFQKAFQQDDFNIEGRLGMLDAASRFVDRQVGWTSDFLTAVRPQLEDEWEADSEAIIDAEAREIEDEAGEQAKTEEQVKTEERAKTEEPVKTPSTLSKIPQYIGYTNRKDVHITPEEGLEKSILVEITEMGKRIVENAMAINQLCEDKNKDKFFKPTDKLITGAVEIATITCTSRDELGKIIDALYFLLYENLERVKKVVTDSVVRTETVYECIFAVKDMRTDFRHDFEHGTETAIKKKRREINDCYRKYCGKIPLKQKDFTLLQKNLFKDILALEEHLIDKLEELQEDSE